MRFRISASSFFVLSACVLAGCNSMHHGSDMSHGKEMDITPQQMSDPARMTMNKEVGNGRIEKVTKEVERGRKVYDVEANVNGRHMEYLIADSNGELLGTEAPIAWNELPAPVKSAAEKYFGTTNGLTAMKGVEYGETHYEIEGMKNGKKAEMSFDAAGKKE
jgi:uncharacterized membrane protein YkoI